jgi:hypothetical protein
MIPVPPRVCAYDLENKFASLPSSASRKSPRSKSTKIRNKDVFAVEDLLPQHSGELKQTLVTGLSSTVVDGVDHTIKR